MPAQPNNMLLRTELFAPWAPVWNATSSPVVRVAERAVQPALPQAGVAQLQSLASSVACAECGIASVSGTIRW